MQAAVGWVARLLPDLLYLAVVGKVHRGMRIWFTCAWGEVMLSGLH